MRRGDAVGRRIKERERERYIYINESSVLKIFFFFYIYFFLQKKIIKINADRRVFCCFRKIYDYSRDVSIYY